MSPPPLTERLRAATRALHVAAERAGVMPALLRGELARERYVLLLRNLHALYASLEQALTQQAAHPCIASLRLSGLERTGALAADLRALHGHAWPLLPVADATLAYCGRLDLLARSTPERLAAHVYVRYLGDLSGGQLLRGIVMRSLGLADGRGVAFYAFGSDENVTELKVALKDGLDRMPCNEVEQAGIVEEARDSFARHVALFEELARPDQPSRSLPAA
jgi:heme oxygenase (biliverdin-producing, ferredoxin)